MPEGAVLTNLGVDSAKTKSAMRGSNPEGFNPTFTTAMRDPIRTIYIYSVAKRSRNVKHLLLKNVTLAGCENGERWVRCTSIPDPIPQSCTDDARGGNRLDEHAGGAVAMDILCPGNFTGDQYNGESNPTYFQNASGVNLVVEGFFASTNEVPTEQEIKKAEQTRDKRYKWLTQEAMKLASISTKKLNEFIESQPDVHTAMDVLGLQAPWHTTIEVKSTCPNCGSAIKQGIAFHVTENGFICVLDVERAYRAGAIDRLKYEELTSPREIVKGRGRREE